MYKEIIFCQGKINGGGTSLYSKPAQITEYLYLGDCTMSDPSILETYDISAVVRLAHGPALPEHINVLNICIEDHPAANLEQYFPAIISFIKVHKLQNKKVLVHCLAGISRSSSAIIAYMMCEYHLSLIKAYNYTKAKSPIIRPNPGFVKQLQKFESSLANNVLNCLIQ